jgi:hypothetical protein
MQFERAKRHTSSDDSLSVNETRFSLLITSRFTQTRHTCVSHTQFSEPSHTSTTLFESGSEFAGKLSEFRPSTSLKESEDADARGRIAVLEEKTKNKSTATASFVVLQDKLKQLSTDFQRLAGEVSTLRSVAAEMRTTLRRGFDELRKEVLAQFNNNNSLSQNLEQSEN